MVRVVFVMTLRCEVRTFCDSGGPVLCPQVGRKKVQEQDKWCDGNSLTDVLVFMVQGVP